MTGEPGENTTIRKNMRAGAFVHALDTFSFNPWMIFKYYSVVNLIS